MLMKALHPITNPNILIQITGMAAVALIQTKKAHCHICYMLPLFMILGASRFLDLLQT